MACVHRRFWMGETILAPVPQWGIQAQGHSRLTCQWDEGQARAMANPETNSEWQEWFEKVWEYREVVLYPSLFGKESRGIFPIPADMITGMFKQESLDPRWLHYGVFEFAPTANRQSWLYVTSGMSNDWEADKPDPTTPSRLGCEFVFETVQQSDWAIRRLLQVMTFQILICHGRFPNSSPLGDYDRIPLRGSIQPEPSALTFLLLAPTSVFPRAAQLDSAPFDFYHVVGISESEAAYGRSHYGEELVRKLLAQGYFPVTDPRRNELNPVELA